MSDGHILVTFQSIQQASQDCARTDANLQQQLSDLKAYLAPMTAVWTGKASEDYQALQRTWDQAAGELSELLQEISRALQVAGENYEQTERSNASIWAG
jgi:6 kDa early secretory antigenic target